MEESSGAWRPVRKFEDNNPVDANYLNRPIDDLVSRTAYLKGIVDDVLNAGEMSSVRFEAELSDTDMPSVGDVVYLDPSTKKFSKALATMSLFDAFSSSKTCFAIGVVVQSGENGNGVVVTQGKATLPEGFDISGHLDDGETFSDGMYYLSSSKKGGITSVPSGPRVQVGVFTASGVGSNGRVTVYVSPQYGDVMSHVHRTYRLAAKPCGTPVSVGGDSGEFGRVRVSGYSPDCVRVGSRTLLSEEVALIAAGTRRT